MTSENYKHLANDQKEFSLKEILKQVRILYRYLLSKWVVILLFGILGGVLGFFYSYFKKSTYLAVTTFVLEDDKGTNSLGSIAGIASMAGLDLGTGGGNIFQGDNILELYRSRKMIEKTLLTTVNFNGKKILLVDRYIDFNEKREKWKDNPDLAKISFSNSPTGGRNNFSRLQDSILGTIVSDIDKSYLKVTRVDKKLSIIKAEVVSTDEFFSKSFNEEIVKNVNDFYIQTKTKKSAENVAILQQKTDSVRRVMNGEIYSAAAVSDATPNLNPTRQAQRTAPIQRSQFSAETNKSMLTELVKNLELSKISLRNEKPLLEVVDVPVFPLYKEKFGKFKGIALGGILFGFFTVLFLTVKKIFKNTFSEN